MVKLFVSGFPLNMTELEIVQLFGPHATISTIKIVRDKVTRKCKGYAFLETIDETHAASAIHALNGVELGDRVLTVKTVEENQAPVRKPTGNFRPYKSAPAAPAGIVRNKRPRRTT